MTLNFLFNICGSSYNIFLTMERFLIKRINVIIFVNEKWDACKIRWGCIEKPMEVLIA